MTVHSAKGLEFPIVILADMTANIAARNPDKHVDTRAGLCAVRLSGCSPWDLIDHEAEEHQRDLAEGIRVAYVAATRARDLLVIPAVGDGEREGWISPLNKAIYPTRPDYRASVAAPGCPAFGSTSVLERPVDYDGSTEWSVKPGLHAIGALNVVWWDPALLNLHVQASFGLRQEEILMEDGGASLELYNQWKGIRQRSIDRGNRPSLNVFLATDGIEPPAGFAGRVQVERLSRSGQRPAGTRFGSLVHLVLRDVDFEARPDAIEQIARTHARLLNAPEDEVKAAATAVADALRHSLIDRARRAARCHRELPIVIEDKDIGLLEAVIDLVFLEGSDWIVVDFKTDVEDPKRLLKYRSQVGWYVHAIEKTMSAPTRGYLFHL
jgi:ATP-dependent exoDNAse (exonuclease V) beta subunit